MSTPFKHHQQRMSAGISVCAEIMLDICNSHAMPTHRALKNFALIRRVASPATLHNAIHELIDAGMLKSTPSKADHRAKLLTITARGKKYLRGIA
jgi:hypothetical protein